MEDNQMINQNVEQKSTSEIEKAIGSEKNVVPYSSMSKLPSLETAVPLSLAGETLQAQFKVQEDIPDVDEYVMQKLAYTSKLVLAEKLAAEQIDAVTLAVRQIENGKGFVLADMAGIGKGRVCASIIRYAYTNGYLPIYITEAPNLFTAMYRDLSDVGGIANSKKISPLIINGYESGGYEEVIKDGKKTKEKKPSPTSILDEKGKELIQAPEKDVIKDIVASGKLPAKYNFLMLTYSQLSGKRGEVRLEYILKLIEKLDGKAVLIIDECHNAVGTTSSTGRNVTTLIQNCQGVLFSSATFSKRPENMFLYSFKTDIADSPITTPKLIELIQKGGERLIENLASNLVLAQQMIRRERTYDNCEVNYEYMSEDDKTDLYSKYNKTIKLYKKLIEFFRTQSFKNARNLAVDRFAKENRVEICKEPFPSSEDKTKDEYENAIKIWEKENVGKYELASFSAGEISRSTFNFVESLLFALKADFVANKTIEQLTNNQLRNKNVDGTEFFSNRKPVIAVRNTLEGIFYYLNIEVGQELDKADFSLLLLSMANSGLSGRIRLKQILSRQNNKKNTKGKEIKGDAVIELSDFDDKGVLFDSIQSEIKDVNLNIPLSPIDYVIDKIQSTKRPSWDLERYDRLTGFNEEYFRVGEVTGRNLSLIPLRDSKNKLTGKYKLIANPKNKNKAQTFKQFNNGILDVLLINESGSTGEDAHSSSKFADQRPRVMIIHQVELDVSTEVQKRGRINRTGMVNYPSYVYAVSRIPSEIRRLLMLAKKLRSLDANTSANQKQSAKLSTIRDSFDNPIEDITNKYGDECLIEFVNSSENSFYLQFMPTDNQNGLGKVSNSFLVEFFTRNLELALCEEQEYFYNTINSLYIRKTDEAKQSNVYDLETNLLDLKALIKARTVISKGENTNPFNTSVYEEEDYIMASDKPYNNEQVQDLILDLSKGEDPEKFYNDFVEDYKKHFENVTLKEISEGVSIPDYSLAKTKEEANLMKEDYEVRVLMAIENARKEYQEVLNIIDARQQDGTRVLKPNSKRVIPAIIEECYETGEDGAPLAITDFNNAKFVGVRILNTAKSKYSPMNIELIFCQLSGKPRITFSPTVKGRVVLDIIVKRYVTPDRLREIEQWVVNPNRRVVTRMMTGNILGAFSIAKDRVQQNSQDYTSVLDFIKFTTTDNTIRVGIQLHTKKFIPLIPNNVSITYTLNSKDLIKDIISSKSVRISVNPKEDFALKYEQGQNYSQLTCYIYGGTIKQTKAKKFYSKLYDDGILNSMLNNLTGLVAIQSSYILYTPYGYQLPQKILVKGFRAILNDEETIKSVQKVFDYIYAQDPFNISLTGISDEDVIAPRKDLPEEELMALLGMQENQQQERVGVFRYNTTKPIDDVKVKLEGLPKFDKIVKNSSFGTAYFNKRANVREAISYGLVPLDSTVQDMVSDAFQSLTSDTDRIKFQENVAKAIKNDESNFNIGLLVEDTLVSKYVPLINIFGNDYNNLEFIGEVFKAYSEGKITLPTRENKQQQQQEQQQEELQKRDLDLDTAQEFLILLRYKINNS